MFYHGQKQCGEGCLGFGDCARACPYQAVSVIDGAAVVDWNACVGCGLCAAACPKGVIAMAEARGKAANRCRSEAAGGTVRRHCAAGCTGCTRCEAACPRRAIAVASHLAHIDPALCDGCGLCLAQCPSKCLVML